MMIRILHRLKVRTIPLCLNTSLCGSMTTHVGSITITITEMVCGWLNIYRPLRFVTDATIIACIAFVCYTCFHVFL